MGELGNVVGELGVLELEVRVLRGEGGKGMQEVDGKRESNKEEVGEGGILMLLW